MEANPVQTIKLVCKGCGIAFDKDLKAYRWAKRYRMIPDDGFYHNMECKRIRQPLHRVFFKEVIIVSKIWKKES